MKRPNSIFALTLLIAALQSCLFAQPQAQQQSDSPPELVPSTLSNLQLDDSRRLELESALRRRDYKEAEAVLVDEAEKDPKSVRTAKLLVIAGGIFFLDGQYLNSAVAWKRAEAIAPLDDRSRFTLAMAYIKLNRREWARSELSKLATAHPQDALYLYWLARLDYDAQNYAAAIARLQKVVELDPQMTRAYDNLGLCYDYLDEFDEAIKNYNQAVELNRLQSKPSPWPHVDLAVTLMALNQPVEAERNLREALRYDSQLPQAHYQLGRALEMQGRYEAAVNSLNAAVELAPRYPDPHYLLGQIYHRLGKNQLAASEIERFKQLKQATDLPTPIPLAQPSLP
jgi:tetratricopeptide (TPR) repeat protein